MREPKLKNQIVKFEKTYLTHPPMTRLLVAVVAAVVLIVASPSGCDALAILTFELALGAFAILVFAHYLGLVTAVPAIVGEVTEPLFRHASIISALEVHFGIALGTVLRALVGTVTAVILAVAEQPLRNATIVRVSGTPLPSGGAIPLPTHVRRLVAVVPAVVVGIAHPQLGNTLAVFAAEFGARIAGTVICKRKTDRSY